LKTTISQSWLWRNKIEADNATIHFELGKNHLALKTIKAYSSFERATQIDPTNKWFWVGMYDVDYETKDYGNAIKTIEKLILLTLNSKKT
jgi:tetratricopeptide (TPR) repeat protein